MDTISYTALCPFCQARYRAAIDATALKVVDGVIVSPVIYDCVICGRPWVEEPKGETPLEFLMRVGATGTLRVPSQS